MITTGFDARVKVQQIIDNQLPEFLISEAPKASEFLKQYYIGQEYQGGPIDIAENLDQYLNFNYMTQDVVAGITSLTSAVSTTDTTISVDNTKGYPDQYGLIKVDDEIITYTGKTSTSFTGCIRGFSGITSYRDPLNSEELIFESTTASAHNNNLRIENLSALFLQEFYRKLKVLLAPGFEDVDFVKDLDINKFIKQIRDFYQSKGTNESFRILFNVLFGHTPKIINLEDFLLKPSAGEYIRREVLVCERISGDPNKLVGNMVQNADLSAAGPVSEVEIISRNNRTFYKIQLFSGFDESSLIQGNFTISPKTKVTDTVAIGASVITVDSTVGFGTTGTLVSGDNKITFNTKNVNQFFNCTGVNEIINSTDDIRSEDTIFGYEDGDITKPVRLRITGVLSDIKDKDKFGLLLKDDLISVKNLGEKVENKNRNFKEFAFNTWIYNVRSRYEIASFSNNMLVLHEKAQPSSLKVGDTVDILNRNAESAVNTLAKVTAISEYNVEIDQNITVPSYTKLSIRKRYDYAGTTSPSDVILSSSNILSDVQNVYNENEEYMYVASNSLPKYSITKKKSASSFTITGSTVISDYFKGYSAASNRYSVLGFVDNVPFITGDEVIYSSSGVDNVISGLKLNEIYHVEVLRDNNNRTNQIRLYVSKSFIGTTNYIEFDAYNTNSTHSFILRQHSGRTLSAKKALTKIPLVPNIQSGTNQATKFGPVGLMVNGVEILNYKTDDKVYYGPIENVKVYNKGVNYDVINPPTILASKPAAVGVGTTALLTAVVRGSVKDVLIDPQNFSIQRIVSATIDGGNGTDADIKPVLTKQYREIEFNASQVGVALTGGVDISNETIVFDEEHRLQDGDPIVYNPSGNLPLGIGTFGGSNLNQEEYLVNGSIYYPQTINPRAIYLYKTLEDYAAGINTVGFTTINTGGMHKFRDLEAKDVISEFKIINPGSGYENRNLKVSPLGITTSLSVINFPNHGFSDGDLVNYTYETTPIIGLSSENSYYIMKIDSSSFQLSNVGVTEEKLGSVLFDGTSDRLDIGGHSDFVLGSGDFTIECWIKTGTSTLDGGSERIIYMMDGPTANLTGNFNISLDSSGGGGRVKVYGSPTHILTSTTAIADDVWHHIAVTRSSGTSRIFIDGVLEDSSTHTYTVTANTGSPRPRMGSWDGTKGDFDGNISNLRLIKGASRYVADFTSSKAPLKKVYGTILLCCKNSGSATAFDKSPSIITATGATKSSASPFYNSEAKNFYESRNYVRFRAAGTGYQSISYPPVKITVEAEITGGSIGTVTATPLVRGEIVDVFVYENGSGYGSKILNFERKPTLSIKNGEAAQLKPIIKDGKLIEVEVQNGGKYYNAAPDIVIKGKGEGAKVRAVVEKGRIIDIIVLNRGTNYQDNNTYISIIPPGRNCVVDPSVRPLIVNNFKRFGEEVLYENVDDLSYSVVGYSTIRDGTALNDPDADTGHSAVIGWANDGNPIYGPYAYQDPKDMTSTIVKMDTGYTASQYNITDRPTLTDFELGYFVGDYKFTGGGHLDSHNGRFTKTPEFPNGVYAYHVGLTTDYTNNTLKPEFPYFVGDTYRSNTSVDVLDQDFDFSNSSLVRNTFPYRVDQKYSGNDFLIESNETYKQTSIIESASRGSVDSLDIVNPGTDYKVGNAVNFVNKNTEGGGAIAEVTSIGGKDILSVTTTYDKFENSVVTWENQNTLRVYTHDNSVHSPKVHSLLDSDRITISGVTTHIDGLLDSHVIGVTSETSYLITDLPGHSTAGIVTDIYVSSIPPLVGSGTTIGIGTEFFSVIDRFDDEKILRVKRELVGVAHTVGTTVYYKADSFTIPLATEYFDSEKDTKIYFNPNKTVGVGVGTGVETSIGYFVGETKKTVSIQTQSIHIPNHPFKNNQALLLRKETGDNAIQVRNTSAGPNLNLPAADDVETVYVINKSKDFIGIVTQIGLTTNTSGLFFNNNGSNTYGYSLETTNTRLTATASKIKSQVSISTVHDLSNLDKVDFIVNPRLSLGIDEATEVTVRYNNTYDKVLIDPVGFNSNAVKSSSYAVDRLHSSFNLNDHKLESGDKVFYSAGDGMIASGLDTGSYFVYKIDDNNIRLTNTYIDVFSDPPKIISIGSTGGVTQELSKVNPQIEVVKNNSLVFNVGDSSLANYDFKLFYDQTVSNEFVSTGTTNTFSVVRNGIVGVNTSASVTIAYNDDLPTKLYYSIEKDGKSVKPDNDVKDYSEILYRPSVYNGTFTAFGIGSTSFYISLDESPERLTYVPSDCKTLKYNTSSLSASGPITKLNIIAGGSNYKKLPTISGFSTSTATSLGSNAIIQPKTSTIGKLNNFRIINEGFEYSSDKTLSPQAEIFKHIGLEASQKITRVEVISGGKNYISPPDVVVVNEYTKKKVETGLIKVKPNFSGNAIEAIEIIDEPKGLDNVSHRIYTLNNSNGIQVVRVTSYIKSSGVVTLELNTPAIQGFVVPPFKNGDKIWIEGIGKKSYTDDLGNVTYPGDGFNSTDHNYNFFRVLSYTNSNPAVLKYNIGDYTSDAGNYLDAETAFTSIVKSDNYPEFSITREPSLFFVEEFLKVNDTLTDLQVKVVDENFIKTVGDYEVKVGDVLIGATSGNYATVNSIDSYNNRFVIDYANKKDFGWKDNTGRLSDDLQVLPDNDYYQNLSYTVKSPITWDKMVDPVNKLVHPVGMKNFADTEVLSATVIGVGVTQSLSPVLDFISLRRVDTISNFDLVQDYNPGSNFSRFIIFKSKKLSDYINCVTNRVLQIDDISENFSSAELNRQPYVDVAEYSITDFYSKFLVQISDEKKLSTQLSEVILLNNYSDTYTTNKIDVVSQGTKLGDFVGSLGAVGDPILRFTPVNPNDYSYNIKVYRESFDSSPFNIGIGYTDIGFARLSSKTERVGPASGSGTLGFSTAVFRAVPGQIDTFYAYAHVRDESTERQNYYEIAGYYDGQDTHIAESYFDTQNFATYSGPGIGTFGMSVENNILRLKFNNSTQNNVTVKAKVVGIGSTTAGVGTYRFLVADQLNGSERTARLESVYNNTSGISTLFTLDQDVEFASKSIIKVGVGSTAAIHNVWVAADQVTANIQHSQFISVGSTSGIGTFSTSVSGTTVSVKFHPDPEYVSDNVEVSAFNQIIYADRDLYNIPPDYTYGTHIENVTNSFYGSLNEFGKDKLDFDLNYKRIPIYEKVFNPKTATILDTATGIFSIDNHFFETGEELIYTPESTLIGTAAEPLGISSARVQGVQFTADVIAGFSTVTGIANTTGMVVGQTIEHLVSSGKVINDYQITGINTSYNYFIGNSSASSTVITGIANTVQLSVGSIVFNQANDAVIAGTGSTIISIGIGSITMSGNVTPVGTGVTFYSTDVDWGLTLNNVSVASTFRERFEVGISTTICPTTVYAIKLTKDTFKLTGTSGGTQDNPGIGFTFLSTGSGNYHKLEMKKKLEKALITIDGVTQYPLMYTPLSFTLANNTSTIGAGLTFLGLTGISSVKPRDIVKLDEEFLDVVNVGLATQTLGPITGVGTFPVIEVKRGFVGTAKTTHTDGTDIRIYKGAFNIVGNKIWFTDAPDGKGTNTRLNSSALPSAKSTFNGRVYLRRDYAGNKIYDDTSLEFNGIGKTFTVYKEGEHTSGVEAGSDLVFINDVFQTPNTINNAGNNYAFNEISGITSVTFTGITRAGTDDNIIVDYDINQNQLPRGGVVVSLGSTGGLGYAPLVGASVTTTVNSDGAITSIGIGSTGTFGSGYVGQVGVAVSDPNHVGTAATIIATVGAQYPHKFVSAATSAIYYGGQYPHTFVGAAQSAVTKVGGASTTPSGATYNGATGALVLTFANAHGITASDEIRIGQNTLTFTCAKDNNATNHAYPRATDPVAGKNIDVTAVTTSSPHTVTVNVGFATIQYTNVSDALYNTATGDLVLTSVGHGHTAGNIVGIATTSIAFTCGQDDYSSEHAYPRLTDPANNASLAIGSTTINTFTLNVGKSPSGDGGELTFNIIGMGTGYENPRIWVDSPAYQNLDVEGVSRLGLGNTSTTGVGLSMTYELAPAKAKPSEDRYGDAAGLIRKNKNLIGEVAVKRMLDKYNGPYEHKFDAGSSTLTNAVNIVGAGNLTPNAAAYSASTGILTLGFAGNHGLVTNAAISIVDRSLAFKCALDNFATSTLYPRGDDPVGSGRTAAITKTSNTEFTVNVGVATFKVASGVGTFVNQDCIDDVIDVVDVVAYNTEYGGNDRVYDAANLYITGAHVADEEPQTIYAFQQARDMAIQAMRNERIGIGSGGQYVHKFVTSGTNAVVSGGDYPHTFVSAGSSAVFSGGDYAHTFVSATSGAVRIGSWVGAGLTPTQAVYTPSTGTLVFTVSGRHNLRHGVDTVGIATNSLTFTCARDNHATQHTYPRTTDPVHNVTNVAIASTTLTKFTVNVGVSTLIYHPVSAATYTPGTGDLTMTVGNLHGLFPATSHTISTATYTPTTGICTFTLASHGFAKGEYVKIDDGALKFTCAKDNHAGLHTYPRSSDPVSGRWLPILGVAANTFEVNVGYANSNNVGIHTLVSVVNNSLKKAKSNIGINTASLTFTCARDSNATQHAYPRAGYAHTFVSAATNAITPTGKTAKTPTGATYDGVTGDLVLTFANAHGLTTADSITIAENSLTFTCALDNHTTNHAYPRATDPVYDTTIAIIGKTTNTITVNVGRSGTNDPVHKAVIGVGATAPTTITVNVGVTTLAPKGISTATYAPNDGKLVFTSPNHGLRAPTKHTITTCTYTPGTGVLVLNIPNHQFTNGDYVKINDDSILMTCAKDNHVTQHSYPRPSDTVSNKWLSVSGVGINTFAVDVGISPDVSAHTFVSATTNGIERSSSSVGIATTSLTFTCDRDSHATKHHYPRGTDFAHDESIQIDSVDGNTFTVNVGVSSTGFTSYKQVYDMGVRGDQTRIPGSYTVGDCANVASAIDTLVGIVTIAVGASVLPIRTPADVNLFKISNFDVEKPGYSFRRGDVFNPVGLVTAKGLVGARYAHKFVSVASSSIVSGGDYAHTFISANDDAVFTGGRYDHTFVSAAASAIVPNSPAAWVGVGITPTGATYNATSGELILTFPSNHNLNAANHKIGIATNSLVFTCARDNHATQHAYPRSSDPIYQNGAVTIASTTTQTLTVNVGVSTIVNHPVSIGTYTPATGNLVLTVGVGHSFTGFSTHTISTCTYTPSTGTLDFTVTAHGFSAGEFIQIPDNSLRFTCAKDAHATYHTYPRSTDPYRGKWLPIQQVGVNTFQVNVGQSNDATVGAHTYVSSATANVPAHLNKSTSTIGINTSSLTFTCQRDAHATQHSYPRTSDPIHNREVGIAAVDASSITLDVGISTIVKYSPTSANYNPDSGDLIVITDNVHNVKVNDVVGINTNSFTFKCAQDGYLTNHTYPRITDPANDALLGVSSTTKYTFTINVGPSPIAKARKELKFTVEDTFSDSFGSWQLGEFDYIDSIGDLQDGKKTRFPLYKNSQLLSFQKDEADAVASLIDFDSILLIYVNGVMQEPKVSYTFTGGTTFTFLSPPLKDDKVDIFFYRGTRDVDSLEKDIPETVKPGDDLQINKNDNISITIGQDQRTVSRILASDTVETGIYMGDGIDAVNYKPVDWTKQKRDILIDENPVYKVRDSLEGLVFPTAKVIRDIKSTDTEVFVDDAQLFNYEENESTTEIENVDAIVLDPGNAPHFASLSANVSVAGTVSSITIGSGGTGFTPGSTLSLKIAPPIGSTLDAFWNKNGLINVGVHTVFKSEITGIGSIGAGSTVITGISTTGIRLGHTIEAIPDVLGVAGVGLTVIGITSEYRGQFNLIDNSGGSIYFADLSVGIGTSSSNTAPLNDQFRFGRYEDQKLATATATVSAAGTVSSISITNPGSGYTSTNAPLVITPIPTVQNELLKKIRFVQGFTGIITGITTTTGIGHPLALTFHLEYKASDSTRLDDLTTTHPIYISNTTVGYGITSVIESNSTVVGIGTTFVDNIYQVNAISRNNLTGIITCNVHTGITTTGIHTMGGTNVGTLSWGRLAGFARNASSIGIAVSGYTVNSGLTTFPTIQRRGYGLRDTGSLRKDLGL